VRASQRMRERRAESIQSARSELPGVLGNISIDAVRDQELWSAVRPCGSCRGVCTQALAKYGTVLDWSHPESGPRVAPGAATCAAGLVVRLHGCSPTSCCFALEHDTQRASCSNSDWSRFHYLSARLRRVRSQEPGSMKITVTFALLPVPSSGSLAPDLCGDWISTRRWWDPTH
jgi:hypothetical protein